MKTQAKQAAIWLFAAVLATPSAGQNGNDTKGLRVQFRNCVFETMAATFNATDHAVIHLLNPNTIAEAGFQACATEELALKVGAQLAESTMIQIKLEIKNELRQAFAGAIYQLQQIRQRP